jgi:hypothetical protein
LGVILFIILIVSGVIYSRVYLHEKKEGAVENPNESSWVQVTVSNENTPSAKAEYLKSAPSVKDKEGRTIVKIINIESANTRLTHVTSQDELYLLPVNPENKEVKARLELLCSRQPKGYSFEGEPLVMGKKLTFDFGFCTFEGTIIFIHEDKKPHQ